MRPELLLLEEMVDAAEQAHLLAVDQTPESLAADEALLGRRVKSHG
jgi:hypothetical protein